MAKTFKLTAVKREQAKKSARAARQNKQIPAIVYGHGIESTPITVDYSAFLKLFRKTGQASVIELDLEGKNLNVLVHNYDLDPVKDTFIHLDFYSMNMSETTIVNVPLEFIGESIAVKDAGGIFTVAHDTLELRCLPKDIPHDIKVDISSIKEIHGNISITDLGLGEELEVMHINEETVICSVVEARVAAEETAAEEVAEGNEEEKSEEDSE